MNQKNGNIVQQNNNIIHAFMVIIVSILLEFYLMKKVCINSIIFNRWIYL